MLAIILLLLSFSILFGGAEFLVRGSSSLANRLGVSPLLVGLTIVAFGTSSPELVVSLKATLGGYGNIALGNVLGSNSFNVGVILGLTALICPIPVHLQIIKFDAPIALGAALLLPLLFWDSQLNRLEAGLLFGALLVYIAWSVRAAKRAGESDSAEIGEALSLPSGSRLRDMWMIIAGLGLLVWGSNMLVDNALQIAHWLEVSDAVIGLTIVAAGTSMPELATSVVAALRKQPDIAVGNVVGSNIFNIFGILGISGLTAPVLAGGIQEIDYVAVIALSALLLPLLYSGRRLIRIEGGILLVAYAAYLWLLWPE